MYTRPKLCDWCTEKVNPAYAITFIYQHAGFLLCSKQCLSKTKNSLHLKPGGYYDKYNSKYNILYPAHHNPSGGTK